MMPRTMSRESQSWFAATLLRTHTVHIAETRSFTLFRVMQTTSPVDGNLTLLAVQSRRTLHAATSADTAEFKQAIEYGAVISDIVLALLLAVRLHVIRCYSLQEIDVVVGVELGHLVFRRRFCSLYGTD